MAVLLVAVLQVVATAELVEVSVDRCASVDAAEVQRIVQIELTAQATSAEKASARVRCVGKRLEVSVDDVSAGRTLKRMVELSSVAQKARPRTLAIAIVELVTAMWSERALPPVVVPAPVTPPVAQVPVVAPAPPPPSAVEPVVTPQVTQPVVVSPVEQRVLRLEAFASLRVLPSAGALEWGGGAQLTWAPSARWGLLVDGGAETGSIRRTLGTLSITSGSVSASLVRQLELSERWSLQLSAGGRLGLARVVGIPADAVLTDGAAVFGVWAGPRLGVKAWLMIKAFVVGLSMEGGYALAQVAGTIDGQSGLGIDGVWVGASIHVGWQP